MKKDLKTLNKSVAIAIAAATIQSLHRHHHVRFTDGGDGI